MHDQGLLIALIIVLVIAVVLYWAYTHCKLDKYLSPQHQKCPNPSGGSFVGAMGQHARLVPCAFPTSPDWEMNRCNYM